MKKGIPILAVTILIGGSLAYYRWVYLPGHPRVEEFAYILPETASLLDSRAEIHNVVATLKNGERVEVLSKDDDWAEVRVVDGAKGWVEAKSLMDSQVYESGERLQEELKGIPVQAQGHTTFEVNLRLDPSRDGALLSRLDRNQKVEIFGRRLVTRPATGAETGGEQPRSVAEEKTSAGPPTQDAWYLVRTEACAGWIYGRLVTLDIPEDISPYAESYNMVAWLVLNTVDDNGRKVPQYIAADREDSQDYDFTHIRVFTWWAKEGRYATAFVQSDLKGYFPIQVTHPDDNPEFRLRLVDSKGHKFQRVFRLYDTVVRPLGTVEGWTSDAMPAANERQPARRKSRAERTR